MSVQKREITEELQDSYLSYAMSVIVSRALPDVRDGLKPVQRRILYSMHEMGLRHTAKHLKCARVVGDVLGSYHPHGDQAVYDTLVRMAQPFSYRYPLIDGQGNFGCFTKDTKIKLTDGRDLSFEELIKEDRQGKKNYTYTVNSTGLISVAEIKNPRLTRKKAEIIKIILDNKEKIKCTPNHLFMLRDGAYKEAKDLKPADSLMPYYQRLSEKTDRLNREGYLLIYQPKINQWSPAHHLTDNYNLNIKKYYKNAGRVRHHIDFNKLNNNPDNIVRMQWGEHWKIHYQNALNLHKNPEYRQKIADGRKKYWSDPAVKRKYSESLSKRNINNWQDSAYREKMRQFLSDMNKQYIQTHPERRKEIGARTTRTLKKLWQNPEYRALMRERIIKGNKNHITNKTGKAKFLNIFKAMMRQNYACNEENFNKVRNEIYSYGAATLWTTGLRKYFQNNPNLIYQEINQNHKVVKIENLNYREDVYDLTIDGSHNFCLSAGIFVHNSLDGDAAAAYRYTEARLTQISEEMCKDLDKETVDFVPNYDGRTKEPTVLPAALPNLLLNGGVGIAVGMATNIPPHNLAETIDALVFFADNPDAAVDDLLQLIKGPDFPTGGIIFGKKAISEAYNSGRGSITTRGSVEIEEKKNEQFNIIISEITYQTNKADFLAKIADLIQDKRIEGVKDVCDESDKDGVRIVLELKSGIMPQKVLNCLYKFTDLQKDFHFNILALVDNGTQPQVLSLKDVLLEYLKHRKDIVKRRAQFDLKKAEERAHILFGLSRALRHIDAIIKTIKSSQTKEEAHLKLVKLYKLSDIQVQAILEMKLQTLAGLERKKIEDELAEKTRLISELKDLLSSPKKITDLIKKELLELKEKYGTERRTKVVNSNVSEFKEEDLVPEEEVIITLSRDGYIKRFSPDILKTQKRGGKGIIGFQSKEDDLVVHFLTANTHNNLLFFTSRGLVYQTKACEIPEAQRTSRGKLIHNFLNIQQGEKISAIIAYDGKAQSAKREPPDDKRLAISDSQYLVMATKNGIIKKTTIDDFSSARRSGLIAIKLHEDDNLQWVKLSSGEDEILLISSLGQAIRFSEKDVRPMSRIAAGVKAIKLSKDDELSGMEIISIAQNKKESDLLIVMAGGFGKKTKLKEFKKQKRGGRGIKAAKITQKTGKAIFSKILTGEEEILAISQQGQILKTSLSGIPRLGRSTQGVRIIKLEAGDGLAGAVCL